MSNLETIEQYFKDNLSEEELNDLNEFYDELLEELEEKNARPNIFIKIKTGFRNVFYRVRGKR